MLLEYTYRVIKKTWFSFLKGFPVNILLYFSLHGYTLFSFYKSNSIVKTKVAFYGKSSSKDVVLYKKAT